MQICSDLPQIYRSILILGGRIFSTVGGAVVGLRDPVEKGVLFLQHSLHFCFFSRVTKYSPADVRQCASHSPEKQ